MFDSNIIVFNYSVFLLHFCLQQSRYVQCRCCTWLPRWTSCFCKDPSTGCQGGNNKADTHKSHSTNHAVTCVYLCVHSCLEYIVFLLLPPPPHWTASATCLPYGGPPQECGKFGKVCVVVGPIDALDATSPLSGAIAVSFQESGYVSLPIIFFSFSFINLAVKLKPKRRNVPLHCIFWCMNKGCIICVFIITTQFEFDLSIMY